MSKSPEARKAEWDGKRKAVARAKGLEGRKHRRQLIEAKMNVSENGERML